MSPVSPTRTKRPRNPRRARITYAETPELYLREEMG
jgi:hypothetical protein